MNTKTRLLTRWGLIPLKSRQSTMMEDRNMVNKRKKAIAQTFICRKKNILKKNITVSTHEKEKERKRITHGVLHFFGEAAVDWVDHVQGLEFVSQTQEVTSYHCHQYVSGVRSHCCYHFVLRCLRGHTL